MPEKYKDLFLIVQERVYPILFCDE